MNTEIFCIYLSKLWKAMTKGNASIQMFLGGKKWLNAPDESHTSLLPQHWRSMEFLQELPADKDEVKNIEQGVNKRLCFILYKMFWEHFNLRSWKKLCKTFKKRRKFYEKKHPAWRWFCLLSSLMNLLLHVSEVGKKPSNTKKHPPSFHLSHIKR